MTLDSFDTVFYTCIFLLPGFIIKSIIDSLSPPAKHNDTKYFFSCLFYSIINCAICSWAYVLVAKETEIYSVEYWIWILVITIVVAALLAFILGVIKQKGVIEWLFEKLNLNKIHPIPTAWDYYFSKQMESWVIVTLKNGKTIYGKFSTNSFASSDSDERDLYIEKTYSVDDDMIWKDNGKNMSILIKYDEISTIEFL